MVTGGKIKILFLSFITMITLFVTAFASVGAITQGYKTNDTTLKPGMVVSLSSEGDNNGSLVEKASDETYSKIIGVATTVEESAITVGSSGQNVFVESSGEVKAYVSDLNGFVKQGDQLTISPLGGIMAVSDKNSKIVLGVALEDFPDSGSQPYEINSTEGNKTVNIAQISVNLDSRNIIDSSKVDSSLERFGKSVVGKNVSEIRVVVALIIFLLVLFALGGILYGAISSAITSLGRNPLAGKIIRKQLIQILIVSLVVLLAGLFAIYVVLWV
ncbi:hypothetical protein HZB74_03495 [Candidatus Saccharibacteria bacterium]|nr:hypothetical protein [Candidatus Saccharibacteria bacterium]